MAKGFGAIMAAVNAAQEVQKAEAADVVFCPFCGQPMDNRSLGTTWFCYSDKETGKCPMLPEIETAFGFHDDYGQGKTIAVVVDNNDEPIVEMRGVRGGRGKTNIRVSEYGYNHKMSAEEISSAIKNRGWKIRDDFPDLRPIAKIAY